VDRDLLQAVQVLVTREKQEIQVVLNNNEHRNNTVMAIQHRSDPGGIKKETTDWQRDTAAKGGPAVGIGDSQNRQVSSPATEDLQTQAAAKGAQKKKEREEDDNSVEGQTKSRSGNRVPGSNH
jgi:hypothetical protein